jgi:hypothetical protein
MKYIGFPRPSYPLAHIVEPAYFGPCNFESNIQEKDGCYLIVAIDSDYG